MRAVAKVSFFIVLISLSVGGAEIGFNRDVRPILADRCFTCHGPDQSARKAKLRLDDPVAALAVKKDSEGQAIAPGKPEESLLVQRIFSNDPDELMPPPESHLSLSDGEKKILREWISQGAKYEPHWAFIPLPGKVAVPAVKKRKWPRNEIDQFVLARLEAEKLKPSRESEKTRWLRRVTYDLNGVPPSPGEIDAFVADKSKDAYEKVADRLLKSPRFGERMATPWLDAARYADSYGYQSDLLSPTWPYRDWVVKAFNRNLPYDQFLIEQVAGDLLPNATRDQKLATAFNRLHRQTNEGGSVEEEWRLEYVADRVHTFGSVFLGLTFECARCHDHRFDPISQRDFYSLSAFFNNIDESGTYNGTAHVPTPSLLLPTAEQEAAMDETARELAAKQKELEAALKGDDDAFNEWLNSTNRIAAGPGLIAHYTFDDLNATNQFVNEANSTNRIGINGNSLVAGKSGQAVRFTGDDVLKVAGVMPAISAATTYTVSFWLQIPDDLKSAVIFQCTDGTDTGFHGTEFSLRDRRLFFVIKRFWPGNAIAIETVGTVALGDWAHVAVSYDGSADAKGMRIYLNGKPAGVEIVRNSLSKDPQTRESNFNFGAQFRSTGLKGGAIDDLKIFNRPLAALEIAQLFDGRSLKEAIDRNDNSLRDYYQAAISEKAAAARLNRMQAVKKFFDVRNGVQETSVMEEMRNSRDTYLLARGSYDAPKNESARVSRSTPSFLPPLAKSAPKDRLGLARWLTQPEHPLTARVAVNRFWLLLFGRGLVATPENFGLQGATPSHPELLDWLARDFIRSGWDTKALLKKMVLSATYRQDSALRRDLREGDPENVLYARGPSHRLPAEMVRDTALAASGLMSDKTGGPPVSPYMPGDLWRESNSMSPAYRQSVGTDLYRRSVYTIWKRTAPMPNMAAFDAPSREVCLMKRSTTGTPQQAFVLLNDPQFVEAARVLAEQVLKEGGSEKEGQIRFAFRRLTAREPQTKELKLLKEILQEQRKIFEEEPERASKLIEVGAKKRDPSFNAIDLAAATALTQAIMNLDATIWKR